VTKPSGASIKTNYLNGRIESMVTPEGTTNYSYACQSQISNITKDAESIDYTYDGSLLTSMMQTGVLNETLNYSYNNDFLVSSMTYAGVTTDYNYNKDGELTKSGDFSISRTLNTTLSKTLTDGTYTQKTIFNGYGEVEKQEDALFGYTLERNANGQIIKKVETSKAKTVSYVYAYDQRARLTKVTKNGIEAEAYSYDANGNRATAKVNGVATTASYTLDDQLEVYGQNTYRYNDDGYLEEKVSPQGTSSYSYNTLGALTQVTVEKTLSTNWHVYDKTPTGANISTVYDNTRQSNVIVLNGSGTANGYRLGYTGENNPYSWKSTDKTIQWSMNFAENYYVFVSVMTTKGHRYIYYTQAEADLGLRSNGSYIHYGLGASSKDGTWQTYTRDLEADLKKYESDNELLTVNGFLVRGSGKVDDIAMIQYGNEILKEDAEGTKTQTITYQQNALNQRVAKLIDGQVVEKYLWADLTTLLAVYDAHDNLKQRFEYADSRMPVAMTDNNGTKYYLHYDQVGSLRAISRVLSPDNTFEVVKEISYDTYGNILTDSNTSFTVPFGFAGGLYDSDTKLTRFGYRDYDAYTGKWTAKDPIGFSGGDSNLYGYVLQDPVNFVDPSGLKKGAYQTFQEIITPFQEEIYDYYFLEGCRQLLKDYDCGCWSDLECEIKKQQLKNECLKQLGKKKLEDLVP
jgi:RHS repeat-associated protein